MQRQPREAVLVVGLGASAGGLEPLEQFFAHLSGGADVAFVVVQHLEPHRPSLLVELLSRHSPLPVAEATDGARPEPGRVYAIPPGALLTLQGGAFKLAPSPNPTSHAPIDAFFRSLATEKGERAVGIILSGAGHDGTAGLRAIKEHGGLTLAQTPETAKHDSMPQSAIEAGLADVALAPEQLAARVLSHADYVAASARPRMSSLEPELRGNLNRLCDAVQRHTGQDFSRYKEGTLLRRILRRMQLLHVEGVEGYLRLLDADAAEAEALVKDLLIGVTHFFRDPEAFEALAQEVIPRVLQAGPPGLPVRIWVAGCASGEEAYSIAILARERIERLGVTRFAQIFATDLDGDLLAEARAGRYPLSIAEHVSPERLARFFAREGDAYQASKELREMCLFSQHSLIRDPPFSQLDLISCRNVLIYLNAELQKKLVPVFHYALRPGGFLFLGPSEGIAGNPELFETADKKHRIFRRKETVVRPLVDFPLGARPPRPAQLPPPSPARELAAPSLQQKATAAFERLSLDEYTAPCALVNGRGEILLVAGRTGRFFQSPSGAPSSNLLDMAPASLRTDLRVALQAAAAGQHKVVRDNVAVELEDGLHRVRLTVRPLPGIEPEAGLLAVVVQEHAPLDAPHEVEEALPGFPEQPAMERLESELRTTRAELKITVQDLESANEELKSSNEELISTNEELQSANEELQTSKEELQSLNEELETVNAELRQKVEELGAANSDLQNLFASTQVATIFLDRELRVAKFTPAATQLFHLLETDVGRPIGDFAPRFEGQDLVADAKEVLRALAPVERQVRAAGGRWFILRVLPYRTLENRIAGVVVTFVDVTDVKRAEETALQLTRLVQLSHDAIVVRRFDGTIEVWNRGAEEIYGYARQEAIGRTTHELLATVFPVPLPEIEAELRRGGCWVGELRHRRKDGRVVTVLSNMQLATGEDGVERILEANRDLTERLRAAEEVQAEKERLAALVNSLSDEVWFADTQKHFTLANPAALREFALAGGKPVDVEKFASSLEVLRPDGTPRPVEESPPLRALSGEVVTSQEEVIRTPATGELRWREVNASPVRDAAGNIIGSVSLVRDITARKRAAEELRASEEKFAKAFQGNTAAMAITRLRDGVFLDVNGRWTEISGFLRAEAIGKPATGLPIWKRAEDRTAFVSELRERGAVHDREFRFARKSGEEWTGLVSAQLTALGSEQVIISSIIDITERTRAEEALRDADRRRNEFLAILSHELRNPLAPIRNSLYILDRAEPGGEQARRAKAVIDRQVDQLARLVDDLLDVTRITRGKVQLQRRRVELNELVHRTLEDHRFLFEQGGVQFEAEPAPEPVFVHADWNRLAQVIGNLLSNSAKFTPRGGRVAVSVAADRGANEAVIRVRDTGMGMAPEMVGHLFEPFMQAEKTLDRSRGGLGLGLALVKGLVELHGGSVAGASDGAGRGATFTVRLPLESAQGDGAPALRAGSSTPRRVLIIEDNVDGADSLKEALQLAGHVAEVAYTGPEGLAKARAFGPDVVLCDIGLPGMDGYDVARAFRADAALKGIRLVALTGYAQPEDIARTAEAGFDAHLAKPPSLEKLQELLSPAR